MADADDLSTVGGRIRWAITKRLGIRQAEAARRLTIKPSQLSRWINNPESPPSEESLARIAQLTGVPQAWLHYGGDLPEAGIPASETQGGTGVRPEVDLLAEGPRKLYLEFMGELFAAGCERAVMERASDMLLTPIAAGEVMKEALQEKTLRSMMPVVRQHFGIVGPAPGAKGEPEVATSTSPSGSGGGSDRMLQDLRDAGQLPEDDGRPEGGGRQKTPA